MSKADYVRGEAARNTAFDHHCHWPGCDRKVPPAMWGCRAHWYRLPAGLRHRIWRAYQPGQEISKTPSAEYVSVARDVEAWILEQEGPMDPQAVVRPLL